MPEENFWTSWCKGRLTEADIPTIRLGATPSGLSSAHLRHPHVFLQAGCYSCRPTNSVKALKAIICYRNALQRIDDYRTSLSRRRTTFGSDRITPGFVSSKRHRCTTGLRPTSCCSTNGRRPRSVASLVTMAQASVKGKEKEMKSIYI